MSTNEEYILRLYLSFLGTFCGVLFKTLTLVIIGGLEPIIVLLHTRLLLIHQKYVSKERKVKYLLDNWYLLKEPYNAGRSMCTKKLDILFSIKIHIYVSGITFSFGDNRFSFRKRKFMKQKSV